MKKIFSVLCLFLLLSEQCLAKKELKDRIKNVVVLMMENRSFDHMCGWLKRVNPEIEGLTGEERNYYNLSDPHSDYIQVDDKANYVDPDPGHSIPCKDCNFFNILSLFSFGVQRIERGFSVFVSVFVSIFSNNKAIIRKWRRSNSSSYEWVCC